MNCPCDKRIHPLPLHIPAGLTALPRQLTTFDQWREAMLSSLPTKGALQDWRGRSDDDLGLMLLEMWAYISDVVSFYDERIAHECYLRTANLTPNTTKLIQLLGYEPRPPLAASVSLALLADGRQSISVPTGTAFRSSAFSGNPPQVFELDKNHNIHPFFNKWTLKRPKPPYLQSLETALLLQCKTAAVQAEDMLYIIAKGKTTSNYARLAAEVESHTGKDKALYKKVTLDKSLSLPSKTSWKNVSIHRSTKTCNLWNFPLTSSSQSFGKISGHTAYLAILDNIYRDIKMGHKIILQKGAELRWYKVLQTQETSVTVREGGSKKVVDKYGNKVSVVTPPVYSRVTALYLKGETVSWGKTDAPHLMVHYGMKSAGDVTVESKTGLKHSDKLYVSQEVEQPDGSNMPSQYMLRDVDEKGINQGAVLNPATGQLTLDQGSTWKSPFKAPVQLYGNLVTASRGQTVSGEILGSGDASIANQSFTLKKKPLTYLSQTTTSNKQGFVNTLKVYVGGLLWQEGRSFYGQSPGATIYIIRQNEKDESVITFGDGKHGARLPSGADNVVAYYRYGAGGACPPAGSVKQLAKPVKGVKSALNGVAASGGADGESAESLKTAAPRSALTMGRAVSIHDFEALAAKVTGVRQVKADWQWHAVRQRPVVHITYIGGTSLAATIKERLMDASDPSVAVAVDPAKPLKTCLTLDVLVDENSLEDDVIKALRTLLIQKKKGVLSHEKIGIGVPLFRSRLFEAVLSVAGVLSVKTIALNQKAFTAPAAKPGSGAFFDFETGGIVINGKL